MCSDQVLCNLAIDNETNNQMQNFNYLGHNVAAPLQVMSTLSLAIDKMCGTLWTARKSRALSKAAEMV
jgi:hypothetical protein